MQLHFRFYFLLFFVLINSFCITTLSGQEKPAEAGEIEKLISRADLYYTTPVATSEEGMPVGNGTMGSLVWTTPSALRFQINRVDIFAQGASSNNFYQRHTDYCGGAGFVDVDFTSEDDVFIAPHFKQTLACYNGVVSTNGNGISTKTMASMMGDVIAVEVDDQRENPWPIVIHLRSLRAPVTRKGNHLAFSEVAHIDDQISLTQEFSEDAYFCTSSVAVSITGRKTKALVMNNGEAKIVVPPGNGKFVVYISSTAGFQPESAAPERAFEIIKKAKDVGFDGLLEQNKRWWRDFWSKSYIHLNSDDGVADEVEKNYTYYLYVMASSSRGKYPPKFNGMIWSTGGDQRKWGSLYWGANQSCLYNALFPTNHIELMDPMFRMYSAMIPSCADAAERQWGSKGIYIPETVAFDGLGDLPGDIADEMKNLYLSKKPWEQRSRRFVSFSDTKLPFLSRWNWKKDDGYQSGIWHSSDKGAGPYGHVTHIFSRGAKIAFQYWLKYEYTQDVNWLRTDAYPIIKGVAEFYRNYPHLRKEEDGRYHLYNVNDNESVWGGHNTIEEISSIKGLLPVAIRAAEILDVDAELRGSWNEVATNISPLPTLVDGSTTKWKRSLLPIVQGDGDRLPDPNTLPVWFFDLSTLESPDETREIAKNTFASFFPTGITSRQSVHVLSRLPVAGSLLGNAESTRYLIPNQIRTDETEVMPNRMDLREGEQTTSIQRLGRAAEALHFAMCQSIPPAPGKDPVIHVFPAWPADWNAQFRLLTRGGFQVSAATRKGIVGHVEIFSQHGANLNLHNPWPGVEVAVYHNEKRMGRYSGDKIAFNTKPGQTYIFLPVQKRLDRVSANLTVE